jgi:glycosyltransferase involved in cell wall biosynthesis
VKVLFVSAGNGFGYPRDVVYNQGNSLRKEGIEVDFFCINGGGIMGYLSALPRLWKRIREQKPVIIHAHYALCGFISTFAAGRPVIVSLMGSELHQSGVMRHLVRIFARYFWDMTIVKSHEMWIDLAVKQSVVIPNGVDLDVFSQCQAEEAIAHTSLKRNNTNVLFAADPGRPEKNFRLASASVKALDKTNTVLTPVFNVPTSEMKWYYNAADVLLLTSVWEGSPNVIKEAMACCCPIVSTDVGDVRTITGSIGGTYISAMNPVDIASRLSEAVKFARTIGRTKGRERIIELKLDSHSISRRIISIYISVLKDFQE